MCFLSRHDHFGDHDPLEPGDDLPPRWLSYPNCFWPRAGLDHLVDHQGRALAADFFVEREREMDRLFQIKRGESWGEGTTQGDEAFHVAGAAPKQMFAFFRETERICVPILAVNRYDVRMPRQNQTAWDIGPETRPEIGLVAGGVFDPLAGRSERKQLGFQPIDNAKVGVSGRRVEADQLIQRLGESREICHVLVMARRAAKLNCLSISDLGI